jgi:predicted ArsR family transcriptional regulator
MSADKSQTTADLSDRVTACLSRHRREGALWTADIAARLCEPTAQVRRALERLVKTGAVERVAMGTQSSWRIVQGV